MKENDYNIKSYRFTVMSHMLACGILLSLHVVKLQFALDIWWLLNTSTGLSGDSRKALHKPLLLRILVNTQ